MRVNEQQKMSGIYTGSVPVGKPKPARASALHVYISILFTIMTMAVVGIFILMAVALGILAVPLNNLFYKDDDGYKYYLRVYSM